jgi:hypothetical protein
MRIERKFNRRSFLLKVGGGAVVGGGALALLSSRAEAWQVSDNDSGPQADPAGHGRGNNHIRGCTDNDRGATADQAHNGRGNGHSDNDSGPNADLPNCGRVRR